MFNIIVAVSSNYVIGSENAIPWNCKEDMKYFRKITSTPLVEGMENAIIMGYNTWKSIGRVLPNRLNIVIDRNAPEGGMVDEGHTCLVYVKNFEEALLQCCKGQGIFVIGGGKIYREALEHSGLDKVYLTKIFKKVDGDVTFPRLKDKFKLIDVTQGVDKDDLKLEFRVYERTDKKHEEYQYLERIDEIMRDGEVCSDRTGVGTKSMWGVQMTYVY